MRGDRLMATALAAATGPGASYGCARVGFDQEKTAASNFDRGELMGFASLRFA
jgi:hypothetical protein